MSWVRIDDHFYDHPKWATAPGDSIALWLAAMAWCNRNSSWDGFIPAKKLHGLVNISSEKRSVKDLVDRRAIAPQGDGFLIHEYAEYQQNEKVRAIREKRSQAGRKGASVRWGTTGPVIANAIANAIDLPQANGWQTPWQTDGNENAPPPTTHSTYVSTQLPPPTDGVAIGGGEDVQQRINDIAEWYARQAIEMRSEPPVNVDAYKRKARSTARGHPELGTYLELYPTATPIDIAQWLHGRTETMRNYSARPREIRPAWHHDPNCDCGDGWRTNAAGDVEPCPCRQPEPHPDPDPQEPT